MQAANARRLIDRLRDEGALDGPPFEAPAERYTSPEWYRRELALFSRPQIMTASSAIAPGACLPIAGALLVRDAAGTLRAFANACRHRGTRLVSGPCAAKALVCPYHGWTYDLRGTLIHVPHAEVFGGRDAGRDLHTLPISERHGLVWTGGDVAAHLGGIDADLAALGLDRTMVWKSSRSLRRFNWKLLVEAFLESYHLRVLHRDSIYPFFLDSMAVAEPVGPHIRGMVGRRALREAARDEAPRQVATPTLSVFPATTIVEHPDFVSILTAHPRGPAETELEHVMLVPADRASEAEHWDRSWQLIDGNVMQSEDAWVCEEIQHGLTTGAIDHLLFGGLERAIQWFHEAIAAGISM